MNSNFKSTLFTQIRRGIALTRSRSEFVVRAGWTTVLTTAFLFTISASAEELPFKGSIVGNFVASPTSDPAIFLAAAHASGSATHVGGFTKVTSDVVNLSTGEVTGTFAMTAPNGDLLPGEYNGYVIPGDTPGAFSWVLNATFTGGTGRFQNAHGQFVFIASGDSAFDNGTLYGNYTETFEGTISY